MKMDPPVSFDDMKNEFLVMDEEIKEKDLLIASLKEELLLRDTKLKQNEDVTKKMIDQMEELHENLAELDARFERSELMNVQLKEEKEEARADLEKQIHDLVLNMRTSQDKLTTAASEVEKLKEASKHDIKVKSEDLQAEFKRSIQEIAGPISLYLEKNKTSKLPMKKTKGYRLLKSTERNLNALSTKTCSNNNNKLS